MNFRQRRPWLNNNPLLVYAGTFGRINNLQYAIRLAEALKKINNAPQGVIIFLNYQGGQNTINELMVDNYSKKKASTDLRNYGIGSQILVDIGVGKMKLLAKPRKMPSMTGYGLQVTEFIENND